MAERLLSVNTARKGDDLQTAARTLEVLCCFSCDQPDWGVTEVAGYLGIAKSAAHRMLRTLEQFGFVEKTPSRRYRLGRRTLELGNVYRFQRGMLLNVEPVVRGLAMHTGLVAHLAAWDGRDVLELMRGVGPRAVVFSPHPIYRMPAHATALGKALLTGVTAEDFDRLVRPGFPLQRFTTHTISDPARLKAHVQEAAAQGYAVDDEEIRAGCRCIAAPVRDTNGSVAAAVSVSGPAESMTEEAIYALLPKLFSAARAVGSYL